MTDVERMAERIVLLHDGHVLVDNGLDELREGFSLALLPRTPGLTRERLLGIDSCIAVRERPEALQAILRREPVAARGTLMLALGMDDVRCQAIALEDMFVELVATRGGES